MTPHEQMRRAATLMREQAAAAFVPWHPWGDHALPERSGAAAWSADVRGYLGGPWGDYAAAWPPPVAMAVADWLDMEANSCESSTATWERSSLDPENGWAERGLTVEANVEHHWRNALDVARTYLANSRSETPTRPLRGR